MALPRLIVSLLLAVLVTVGLFMLMKALIQPERDLIPEVEEVEAIEITRAIRDEQPATRDRDLQRPTRQDDPPPPPPPTPRQTTRPNLDGAGMGLPRADIDLGNLSGAVVLDRDPQPIVRIPPQYPRRAAQRGQEGYVIVEFTIAVDGSVKDPRVVESSSSVFDREAVRAVSRWKYRPQIANGEPIERPGLRVTIDFQLDE